MAVIDDSRAQPFTDQTPGQTPIRGYIHRAESTSADGLVLTHGAGGNCNAPLLVALGEVLSTLGITVLRCDLPFRQARPHGPPSPASARLDQDGLRRAVTVLKGQITGRMFLGGVSYGGRQASMLAAAEPSLVAGLFLLSYPLHPPGRPQQMRTDHFPNVRIPALFVSGTKDPFGSVEEMEAAIRLIPSRTRLLWIADVGHSLLSNRNRRELVSDTVEAFRTLFASVP